MLLFEVFSGLKINFNKSSLFASKGAKQLQCKFADYIGCPAKDWPLNYPGHDISPVRRNRRLWAPLVKKIKLKLSHWKGRSLNKAGRLVMLKSSLNNISLYWTNTSLIPVGILKEIDFIRRNFFWGKGNLQENHKKKMHLLCWDAICKPKWKGGLGVQSLQRRNLAMLCKWLWKFKTDRNSYLMR